MTGYLDDLLNFPGISGLLSSLPPSWSAAASAPVAAAPIPATIPVGWSPNYTPDPSYQSDPTDLSSAVDPSQPPSIVPAAAPAPLPSIMPPTPASVPSTPRFPILSSLAGMLQGKSAGPAVSAPAGSFMAKLQAAGSGLGSYIQNNPTTIDALAAGLSSTPNIRSGISAAAGAMPQARQADVALQGQKAVQSYFQNPAITRSLTPAQLTLLQNDPELAQSFLTNTLTAKPTFQQIGTDPYTGVAQYGWVDAANGSVTPVSVTGTPGATGTAPAGAAPGQSGAGGGAPTSAYDSLPPNLQTTAQKMVAGQVPYQTARQMGMSPQLYNTVLEAANEWAISNGDPAGFDATRWPVRNSALKNFTSGAIGQTITAGNTAIQHVGQLNGIIDKLPQGMFGSTPFVGYATRALQDASVRGTPQGQALQQWESTRQLVADEMTKFYRGAGGSESDVQAALSNFDAAKSPAELHTATAALVNLMQSKVDALQQQWHSSMGDAVPDFKIMSPESVSTINQILQSAEQSAPDIGQPPPAAPKAGAVEDGYRFKGGDPSNPANWELVQ